MNPHILLLTAVCSSLAYLLYRKRQSDPSSSSHDALTDHSSQPAYIKHEPTIPTTFIFPQEPDYFPFTEAIPYRIRMGVKKMAHDAWIEIGPAFEHEVQLKKTILRDHRDLVSTCFILLINSYHL